MPELPEVEIVRRGLADLVVERVVGRVIVHDSPKSYPNSALDTRQFVVGASVTAVRRRAKVILIDLSTSYTLVVHLKMTGQLVFIQPRQADEGAEIRFGAGHPNDSLIGDLPDRSTRVTFEFTDGSQLFFNDQRKFGWVKLYPMVEVANIDFMRRVGPEPLDSAFGAQEFEQRIRRRNGSTVKAAILDQSVLAGVGNIYADESLWGAKIHPAERVKNLSGEQLADLLREIKYVMNLSIEKGGSSSRNYVNAAGEKGNYLDFARVYARANQPCGRHPDQLIEKTRVAGRGTHFCPVCQPSPTEA